MIVPRAALGGMHRGLSALRRAVAEQVEDVNRLIFHVLHAGIIAAVGLILFAFLLGVAETGALPEGVVPLEDLGLELLRMNPSAYLSLGIIVLVVTPVARVLASLLSFLEERDRLYVLVTGLVLLNLLVSLLLGLG